MKKYIFVENGKPNGCGECECLDGNVLNVEVSEAVYETYLEDNLKYVYQDGVIVENPNYEAENKARQDKLRAAEILAELDELDKKRVRAMCEEELKDEYTGETWLDYYNKKIAQLRDEYKSLTIE
ncbi:MAG: hypothetical protein NC191_08495 [Muribaculaceae bacterium]|nr:hypothetical protein [Muribaculaceae bacterium]